MSKVMLRKLIRQVIQGYTKIQIVTIILGVIAQLIVGRMGFVLGVFFMIALGSIAIEIISIGIVYLIYFIENKMFSMKMDYLERDIPKEIPPAIASVLLDFYVDDEQDYLATVSSLISRGYLEIVNNQEIIIKNNNLDGLLEHEILAFEIISRKALYSPSTFREKTIEDAKKLGLMEKTNRLILKWKAIGKCILDVIILLIISVIGAALPEMLEGYEFIEPLVWIVFLIVCAIYAYKIFNDAYMAYSYNSPTKDQSLKYMYNKTKKGEEYAEIFAGLRLFFKEYTLMNEKELESIKIFDDYIPYAIALGEADAIAKFIEKDNDCRRLIYRV